MCLALYSSEALFTPGIKLWWTGSQVDEGDTFPFTPTNRAKDIQLSTHLIFYLF